MKGIRIPGYGEFVFTILIALMVALSGCGSSGSEVTQTSPVVPTGINVTVSGSTELTISWNPVSNATSYNIYWSTSPGVNKSSSKIAGVTSPYIHQGLSSGTTYYYIVTAVNNLGESAASAVGSALLSLPNPPAAVAAVAENGQVTVSWNTNGANSYNIYMATTSGVTKLNAISSGSSTTGTYTQTGLTNGTTYYFVVTSVNTYGEGSESSEVVATPAVSSSPTVTGWVKYEDKEYWANTSSGNGEFTGITSYKAVRYATVEAVNAIDGTTVLASGATDALGNYSLTLGSAATVYVRAISSTTSPTVNVKDMTNTLYSVAGSSFYASGTSSANIQIPSTSPASGAFNMMDVFTTGAQFIQALTASYPPALSAYWQTNNSFGTYYCSGVPDPYCSYGEGIYVLNSSGDTDEYDDDVLWHEYGHFIANKYSRDDSPGGAHTLSSNDLDLRLSWSEGWGDFTPAAVKTWLANGTADQQALLSSAPGMATSMYVDTSNGYFDFGNPGGAPYVYASGEVAIAKVLIGLRTNVGMQDVWDTFTSSNLTGSAEQVNLEVFFDAWNSLAKPSMVAYLSDRLINYSADAYEAAGDNTISFPRVIVLNTTENHTLYGSGDVDYVAFNASPNTQYTIQTLNLKNGTDTFIEVLRPNQTSLITNDNANLQNYAGSVPNNCSSGICEENGYDILASKATINTGSTSGTYYVKVTSSSNRPLSAGKYGDYTLKITSP